MRRSPADAKCAYNSLLQFVVVNRDFLIRLTSAADSDSSNVSPRLGGARQLRIDVGQVALNTLLSVMYLPVAPERGTSDLYINWGRDGLSIYSYG